MRPRTPSRLALLAALAACAMSCGSEAPHAAAEADYARYCALCHGDGGEGYVAPRANALSNAHFLAAADDAFLKIGIVEGRPGTKMSAWGVAHGGPLSDAQADGLVALMRSWQGDVSVTLDSAPLAGELTAGKTLYASECATCHGPDGSGGSAMSLNHPLFLGSASDAFLRAAIRDGRPGTPMPAYGAQLDSAAIDGLIRAIRAMERQP